MRDLFDSWWVLIFFAAAMWGLTHMGKWDPPEKKPYYEFQLKDSQRFILRDVKGSVVRLDDLLKEHDMVLLNFWASWCPISRGEIADLIPLRNEYSRRLAVIGINLHEEGSIVREFLRNEKINYPIILDEDRALAEKFGAHWTPTNFLILPDGKVRRYRGYGGTLPMDIKEVLEKAHKDRLNHHG